MKKNSETKMNCGINAYNDWRKENLLNFNYDVKFYCDGLNDLYNFTFENMHYMGSSRKLV